MLVYANSFDLQATEGPSAVIQQIASWVGRTRKTFVDPVRVARGISELKLPDGATFKSVVTWDGNGAVAYPYLFCATLMHGQEGVPGRRWVVEVGMRRQSANEPTRCSVLMRTDEISARITTPVQVTRPGVVTSLVSNCIPAPSTPSISVINLTEENAVGFSYDIERNSRRHPIVIVSCDRDGNYPVDPERLRSILVGLAQVVVVEKSVDTFRLEAILGRRYSAYGGAINIIFQYQSARGGAFCKTVLMRPEELAEFTEAGSAIETEVLSVVTHSTNLPQSWRHTSPTDVSQAMLLSRLQAAAKIAPQSAETALYEELLQGAAEQIGSKTVELDALREDFEAAEGQADQLRAEIEGLKHALSGTQARSDVASDVVADALVPLREAVTAVLAGSPSLEQALRLAKGLFSDRIVVLDEAYSSAKSSDRSDFQHGGRAFELLSKLAGGYWEALAAGGGDNSARAVFGNNAYSAKEADTLSVDGRRRRTFSYLGKDLLMERHLKHGVKDSAATTLRIHFEWISEQRLIVIGHCGKHLDF